jgi:hypothetical protein
MAQQGDSTGYASADDAGSTPPDPAVAASGADAADGSSPAAAAINGRDEDAFWRDHYITRPYADDTLSYDHYRPAYRYGWESRARLQGRRWDEVERDLEKGWRENRGTSRLGWTDARQAARDAWQRIDNLVLDERQRQEAEAVGDETAAAG